MDADKRAEEIRDMWKKMYVAEEDEIFALIDKLARHPKAVEYLARVLKEMGKRNATWK